MAKRRAKEKLRVRRTKICSQRYLRQIHPVWLFGPVPRRFWEKKENRRDYLLWLGHRLRFERMEDWYTLTYKDLKANCGQGLAHGYWHSSPIAAVKECFPEYEWHEWLFGQCPIGFWDDENNHRRYMDWLGQQLGFQRPEDWYSLKGKDVFAHNGGAFLLCYDSSVSAAVMSYLPDYEWREWIFVSAPMGFWMCRRNCRRYMKWLGGQLGYECLDDWYNIMDSDFRANHGRQLLHYYGNSPTSVVKDLVPRRQWYEWMFGSVPQRFWRSAENRKRYVKWLGKRLGYRRPEDWRRVRRKDFVNNYGGGLAARGR